MTNETTTISSECDKEQIHFIESIQPWGALLAVSHDGTINSAAFGNGFTLKAQDVVGKNIEIILENYSQRILESVIGRSEPTAPIVVRPEKLKQWLTCIAHMVGTQTILELEIVQPDAVVEPAVKFMDDRGRAEKSLESYLAYLAEDIRSFTSYDRVMIYKFSPDWHGEVVAEAKETSAHSFLQHHFPASDIPEPARRLFAFNWIRMICDTKDPPCPLVSEPQQKPIDLTKSIMRAPATIHIDYLKNMNVRASLTLSLICDGKLWGLIACHNFSPRYIPAEQRFVLSLIAKVASSKITSLQVAHIVAAHSRLSQLSTDMGHRLGQKSFLDWIRDDKSDLLGFVAADGFSFVGEQTIVAGVAPSPDQLKRICAELNKLDKSFVQTDCLVKTLPRLSEIGPVAAGLMAIKIRSNWAIWTKREVIQTLTWAGDPNKPLYSGDTSTLSPRSSFGEWREKVKETSTPWADYEIHVVGQLQQLLIDVINGRSCDLKAPDTSYMETLRRSIKAHSASLQTRLEGLDIDAL